MSRLMQSVATPSRLLPSPPVLRRRLASAARSAANPWRHSASKQHRRCPPACAVSQPPEHWSPPPSLPPATPAVAEQAGKQAEQLDWSRQWYPLAPLSYLDRTRPAAYTVLGRQLAVWYHAPTGSWQVFEDRCPHRLAPLSEGRVEPGTGNLQCSYHGWQFSAGGRAVHIPQADSPQQEAAACGNPRSCVASFPVRVEQGMLWVWMDASLEGALASLQRPLPLPAELRPVSGGSAGVLLGDWYQRDLPVSYEYLLENLLDPSHVHIAHHGVIGSRNRASPIQLQQEGDVSAQGGFLLSMKGQWGRSGGVPRPGSNAMPAGMPSRTHFVPPGLVWLEMPVGVGDNHFSMLFYAVPVGPGTSRLLAGYSTSALPQPLRGLLQSSGSGALAPLLHALRFLGDLGSHEVIDGDLIHIYQQEQVARREGRKWHQAYFMPASADRGVVALRRWLDELAGGGPQYHGMGATSPPDGSQPLISATTSRPLSRREILDRYEQHTRHCPSCRRALGTVRLARQVLQAAAASGFAAAFTLLLLQTLLEVPLPLLLARPSLFGRPASLPMALGAAALTAGVLQQVLGSLEVRFVFVDYVHPEK